MPTCIHMHDFDDYGTAVITPGTWYCCCTRSEISFRAAGTHCGTPFAMQISDHLTSVVRTDVGPDLARNEHYTMRFAKSLSVVRLRRPHRTPVPCCCRTREELILGGRNKQLQTWTGRQYRSKEYAVFLASCLLLSCPLGGFVVYGGEGTAAKNTEGPPSATAATAAPGTWYSAVACE